MFHNISNPKWFGNWSRLEDDYLGNGGTDIADNFTFSKMEKTGGLFGSIVRLATAFPACDPETGHATGAWKVACESIDLDEVPLSDIADMISGFDCETITDFRLFNTGAFGIYAKAFCKCLCHVGIKTNPFILIIFVIHWLKIGDSNYQGSFVLNVFYIAFGCFF